MMSNLQAELHAQDDLIRDILSISKCPSLSVGVLSHGKIIHTAHYGTREVGKDLPPNNDTIYRIASLTKVLTASAVAALVEDGVLSWDTPIREYLPDFRERQDDIGLKATLRDLLSNRTGIANGDYYWGQQYGEFLMPHDELVRTAVHVPVVRPFGKRFLYAGWNYGLATEVVEAVTGTTLGQFIDQRILRRLGMNHTTLGETTGYDNTALGYAIDSDGSHHHVSFPQMDDGLGLAGAYGGKSSLKDVLTMYCELMKAQQDQSQSNLSSTPGSPFTHTKQIFEPHIKVLGSTSYCLGLYKTTLPGLLGIASLNSGAWLGFKNYPIFGESIKGLEVGHHAGVMPSGTSSAFLVPDTQTAVVVLANASGLMDPTDFVAQQLLAVLVGEKPNTKLRELAEVARAENLAKYPKLHAHLSRGYTGKIQRQSEAYEGHYWNAAGNFCLTITKQANKGLRMRVQDVPRTGYNLVPYDADTWWFPPDRKEQLCEKEMQGFMHPEHHLVSFAASEGTQIDRLLWQHDHTTTEPEVFLRSGKKPTWKGYPFPKARL